MLLQQSVLWFQHFSPFCLTHQLLQLQLFQFHALVPLDLILRQRYEDLRVLMLEQERLLLLFHHQRHRQSSWQLL